MEWNWNPVRMFVSRLQNLSAMRPQATTFDFLPKLSSFSLPSFGLSNWGWWGGNSSSSTDDSKMNDGDGEEAKKDVLYNCNIFPKRIN